jgi:hypothetical protein
MSCLTFFVICKIWLWRKIASLEESWHLTGRSLFVKLQKTGQDSSKAIFLQNHQKFLRLKSFIGRFWSRVGVLDRLLNHLIFSTELRQISTGSLLWVESKNGWEDQK